MASDERGLPLPRDYEEACTWVVEMHAELAELAAVTAERDELADALRQLADAASRVAAGGSSHPLIRRCDELLSNFDDRKGE